MSEINQNITGDNNLQVGTNNGQIIQTKQIKQVTEVLHDPNQHITDAQALEIRNKITELVDMLASTGKNKGSLFKQEYNTFYKEFKISSYKLLPKDKYEEALIWLRKRNAYKGKKVLRQGNKEEWRKEQYTAIYFKAGNLGMSKEDLYLFATEKLALKKPLTSLKELSDTRLEKLYKYIIVKK
ncbi:ORF6C domain-containing protein [Capnocytophaga stomatis]|uniref:ORF6C domain-containing protein n=1 Tax=Capnocytophaga stomatis TaxID=1848904 RepID=UPI001AC357F2|nr:ORF6C domain-containing protein [Capnocytophaga stomatis]GIM50623.1 hypothetical protein CAPN003_20750 [Capnocytophaga stomatis]